MTIDEIKSLHTALVLAFCVNAAVIVYFAVIPMALAIINNRRRKASLPAEREGSE